ncbi:ATP-binding cassette domain-containing protein [Nocardiopsis akebiae]|uniref:ATP-binding cassette domain-containing protein n=1 Tax=Nocardiopsis akebiae TaxID=2831968 RepID=UPI0023DF49AA|nr:ATP-binding cassette domain-containing protein [Nocardiopsis akebiae]
MPIIDVGNLHKRYGDKVVVDDVSFSVEGGEIFAILGSNGAGKTTTVGASRGRGPPARGAITVLVRDPGRERDGGRQRLGIQLQEARLPDRLRVGEALDPYASFCRSPASSWSVWASPTSAAPSTAGRPGGRSRGCPSPRPSWAGPR